MRQMDAMWDFLDPNYTPGHKYHGIGPLPLGLEWQSWLVEECKESLYRTTWSICKWPGKKAVRICPDE